MSSNLNDMSLINFVLTEPIQLRLLWMQHQEKEVRDEDAGSCRRMQGTLQEQEDAEGLQNHAGIRHGGRIEEITQFVYVYSTLGDHFY